MSTKTPTHKGEIESIKAITLWQSTAQKLRNIHFDSSDMIKKGSKRYKSAALSKFDEMNIYSCAMQVPNDVDFLENVIVNGCLAYEAFGKSLRTSLIAGGGRFELRRSYYDGEQVMTQIIFRDMIYFGKNKPKISLVVRKKEVL